MNRFCSQGYPIDEKVFLFFFAIYWKKNSDISLMELFLIDYPWNIKFLNM